jgi:hypothetical protein
MRQRLFAIVFALVALACVPQASSAAAKVRVSVTPSVGKQRTSFLVRFRAPNATGSFATVQRHFQVSAASSKGRRCSASDSVAIGPTKRGQRLHVALKPKGARRLWCTGKFHGRVLEISRIVCRPTAKIACPAIEIAPVTIRRFTFRVKKSTKGSSGSGAAPTFGGLVSAVSSCPPLQPQALPIEGHVYLSWNAATDPDTPSSELVYEIYYSGASGGENYAKPTWTTVPGTTHFLATVKGFGSAYFVVRARDRAGRQDHNTVQRIAVNACPAPLT